MGGEETAEIHRKVKELVADNVHKVVIDLSDVTWMNSSGIGALMASYTTLRGVDGHMRVCGAKKQILHLLEITKMLNFFSNYFTVEEALQSFK